MSPWEERSYSIIAAIHILAQGGSGSDAGMHVVAPNVLIDKLIELKHVPDCIINQAIK